MDSAAVQSEYSCARCNVSWRTKSHLLKHMILTHRSLQQTTQKTEFYECPTCGKEFAELSKFVKHLFVHRERKFKCSKCHKAVCNLQNLITHSLTQHGIDVTREPTNYRCDDCLGMFSNVHSFILHSATHKPPQFSCSQCDQTFFSWSGVRLHTKSVHLGEKPKGSLNIGEVSCELCELKFTTAKYLKAHLKRVHLPKQHKCPQCYREFSGAYERKNHLLKAHSLHEGTDFKCKICHKTFKTQASLVSHSRFHGNPTFSCGQCPRKFHVSNILALHVQRVHNVRFAMPAKSNSKEINYTCAVCCRPFGLNKKSLPPHLQTHYFKPQVCPVCQSTLSSEAVLKQHIRLQHPDNKEKRHCGFCNKHFPSRAGFQMHMKYHEKPTMACPDCPLLFYNKVSLRSHSTSHNSKAKWTEQQCSAWRYNEYACSICLRKFPLWCQLRDHLIKTHNPTAFGCSKCDFQCYTKKGVIKHLQHFHS